MEPEEITGEVPEVAVRRRRRWVPLAGIVAVALIAPPLLARSGSSHRPPTWEERTGRQALGRVDYDWRALDFDIEFLPGKEGKLGGTYPAERKIRVYVRRDQGPADVAHITAHEIGHAVDLVMNTDDDRARYRDLRGITTSAWFTCSGCTDLSTPAGDFAETFAMWATGDRRHDGEMVAPPSQEELDAIAPLFTQKE